MIRYFFIVCPGEAGLRFGASAGFLIFRISQNIDDLFDGHHDRIRRWRGINDRYR